MFDRATEERARAQQHEEQLRVALDEERDESVGGGDNNTYDKDNDGGDMGGGDG